MTHPEWRARFPWLIQGMTRKGDGPTPFDLGLFGGATSRDSVLEHWAALREVAGMARAVHAHQAHGSVVRFHRGAAVDQDSRPDSADRLDIVDDCDGHATATPGVLLAVTTADCVPVFVADGERRAVAVLHAGWRGVAAGVLEQGLLTLRDDAGSRAEDLHVHFGPAICGDCYEVGPEVFEALGVEVPPAPVPIDLRAVLAGHAVEAGVRPDRVTVSGHCTLCGAGGFFSHRGGARARQVGYIGIRE